MTEHDEHARDRLQAQDQRVRALGRNEALRDVRQMEVRSEEAFVELLGRGLPYLKKEQDAERDARGRGDVRVADFVE